jgi:hypothetical protein
VRDRSIHDVRQFQAAFCVQTRHMRGAGAKRHATATYRKGGDGKPGMCHGRAHQNGVLSSRARSDPEPRPCAGRGDQDQSWCSSAGRLLSVVMGRRLPQISGRGHRGQGVDPGISRTDRIRGWGATAGWSSTQCPPATGSAVPVLRSRPSGQTKVPAAERASANATKRSCSATPPAATPRRECPAFVPRSGRDRTAGAVGAGPVPATAGRKPWRRSRRTGGSGRGSRRRGRRRRCRRG